MATSYLVFDAQSTPAALWRTWIDTVMSNGVVANVGNTLNVLAPVSGMTVRVQDGAAIVGVADQGAMFRVNAGTEESLSVGSNNTGSTRQDYVAIRADITVGSVALVYKQGTTSPPALLNSSTQKEIAIAQVAVPHLASNITQGMITDTRSTAGVGGYSLVRSVPLDTNLEFPIPVNQRATIIRHITGANANVTPPVGKMWYVVSCYFNSTVSLTNAVSPTIYYFMNGNGGFLHHFARPFLLANGQNVYLATGNVLQVYEVVASADITPVQFAVLTPSTTYTVPAGNRLVISRAATVVTTSLYVYDQALGTFARYIETQMALYAAGTSLQLLGNSGSVTTLVPRDPQMPRPVIVGPGRVLVSSNASACYIMGYTQPDYGWTTSA